MAAVGFLHGIHAEGTNGVGTLTTAWHRCSPEGSESRVNKLKRKKGEHFPSPTRLGAMTDSHLEAFFRRIKSHSPGETFPHTFCMRSLYPRSAIYRAISKLFDIALAGFSDRH
jgi:hypothetical protein